MHGTGVGSYAPLAKVIHSGTVHRPLGMCAPSLRNQHWSREEAIHASIRINLTQQRPDSQSTFNTFYITLHCRTYIITLIVQDEYVPTETTTTEKQEQAAFVPPTWW